MNEYDPLYSERLERFEAILPPNIDILILSEFIERDRVLKKRIVDLLNHDDIDETCYVDAEYYDCSVIPSEVKDSINNDAYFLLGKTKKGETISKWVNRWDLDSDDPIENGEVIREEKEYTDSIPPDFSIKSVFNPSLLSVPTPEFGYIYKSNSLSDEIPYLTEFPGDGMIVVKSEFRDGFFYLINESESECKEEEIYDATNLHQIENDTNL